MLCGSLSHVDDDPWSLRSSSSSSSPRRSSKRKEKNPYANRGLDKFKMVLADLEARKEKIMTQMGASDAFLVRFAAQTNLRDWVPIVIKLREPPKQQQQKTTDAVKDDKTCPAAQRSLVGASRPKSPVGSSSAPAKEVVAPAATAVSDGIRMDKRLVSWGSAMKNCMVTNMRRPSNYWPLVLILILLCLLMFGRSFAIMCTSICWYLVPTTIHRSTGNDKLRRPVMGKNYGRRLSSKNLQIIKMDH